MSRFLRISLVTFACLAIFANIDYAVSAWPCTGTQQQIACMPDDPFEPTGLGCIYDAMPPAFFCTSGTEQ